jgi:hypothetical protein
VSKPFDVTLKTMLEDGPADWPVLAGLPLEKASVVDADVSTFSGGADKVLRVRGSPDWIMHVEFQSGPDQSLPHRVHVYNGLLEDRHGLLVRSVVILLAPRANLSSLTGVHERRFQDEPAYLVFRYQVIRLWQVPVERLLAGGFSTLPLAPISAVTEPDVPQVIEEMKRRWRGAKRKPRAADFWGKTYVLMGLRYATAFVDDVLQGVVSMEDSVTYQAMIARAHAAEARRLLLLQGRHRFGQPPAEVVTTLEATGDLERLEELGVRLLDVGSWQELLETPPARPARRRRNPG